MRLLALQPGSGNEPSDIQHHQRNSLVLALGLPVRNRI